MEKIIKPMVFMVQMSLLCFTVGGSSICTNNQPNKHHHNNHHHCQYRQTVNFVARTAGVGVGGGDF
jgi:hypothetical protein